MFTKEDFAHLKLPIYEFEGDILIEFKDIIERDLPSVQEFVENGGRSKISMLLKYIAFAYDENSPLVRQIDDTERRLSEAALLASYGPDNKDVPKLFDLTLGEYSKQTGAKSIGKGDDKREEPIYGPPIYPMAKIVCEYVLSQKSFEFKMLVMSERIFMNNFTKVMTPSERTKDSEQELKTALLDDKLSEVNSKQLEKIVTYREKLFGGNDKLNAAANKGLRPEDYM